MKKREHGENYMRQNYTMYREMFGRDCIADHYQKNSSEITEPTINRKKVNYEYTNGFKNGKAVEVKGSYEVRYSVIIPEKYKEDLTAIDRRVLDAVCNLYLEGYEYMTIYEIFRYLYPKKLKNPRQLEEIKYSIDKLNCTIIDYDISEEAKAYKWDKYFKGLRDRGRLIDLRSRQWDDVTEELKKDFPFFRSTPKIIIHIIAPPFLLEIAEKNKKQVQYIPRRLFLGRDYKKIPKCRINEEIFEKILDNLPRLKYGEFSFIYDNLAKSIHLDKSRKKDFPDRVILILEWFKECELIGPLKEHDAAGQEINYKSRNGKKPYKITIYGKEQIKEIEAVNKKDSEKSYSR